MRHFEAYAKKRENAANLEQHHLLLISAGNSLKKARKFKTKGHLTMKELLLQEKLLGNLGRWEEAVNNKKVGKGVE